MVTPTRAVMCATAGCANEGEVVTVPDDGSAVECGACGTEIAPQAPEYVYTPPPGVEPLTEVVDRLVSERLAQLDPGGSP